MPELEAVLTDTLRRVYPQSALSELKPLTAVAIPRNGAASFQVAVRNTGPDAVRVSATLAVNGGVEATVRRVGLVPMRHHNTATPIEETEGFGHVPGFVPDPLFPERETTIGPFETQAFWVSLRAHAEASVGPCRVAVTLTAEDGSARTLEATVGVGALVLKPLSGFPITHWFYADALCDWYGFAPFDAAFWPVAERYMANLTAHHSTCQYVPLFTPPTDGVKRPTQLLGVRRRRDGSYAFSFTQVRRWLRTARRCGAQYFEWTHWFTQWGVEHAIRVYRSNAAEDSLLWPPDTAATSPVYREFLRRLLPELRAFLDEEGVLDRSFFHVSDEPGTEHLANYRAAREMLREIAPWMKVCDALSHVEFGRLGLTDIPIPSINAAREYADEGIPAWTYFCCGPRGRYLNRLMDTPLAKIRTAGRLLHKLGAQGFLHWGYNYWYRSQTRDLINPFEEQAGGAWPGWPYGDPFVVYPGADGPLVSIRWEVWGGAMQDLAILRQMGIGSDHPEMASIEGYDAFDWSNPTSPLDWNAPSRSAGVPPAC
ncbi:MAG: DUF4091 domain-containing protein [Armatimonadetes bacterium]|nr:DUF4091 domain-containing protein [Armatimonadota bacterium]